MSDGAGSGQVIPVKVLFTEGCASAPATVERIRAKAAELGVEIALEEVLVATLEEAEAHRFLGSPTVQVNGLDLEPAMRGQTRSGFS